MHLDDIRNLDFEDAMLSLSSKKTRRGRKIKSPTAKPRSGGDVSCVVVRVTHENGSVTIEKRYRKIHVSDTGYFTTPDKYSAPRFAAGKSRNNPQFMLPENEEVVAYFKSTPTTPGYKTYEDKILEDLQKRGMI